MCGSGPGRSGRSRIPDLPVPLSGSALTTIVDCPLRWFLTRRAGGETPSTSAIGFGMVLHTLADAVATGTLPPDMDELNGWLDKVWTQLEFESSWISDRERVEAEQALRRFVAWHQGRPDRTLLGTEVEFDVLLPDTDKPGVRVKGRMDRLEQDGDGDDPGGRPEDGPDGADQARARAARPVGDLPARDRVPPDEERSATIPVSGGAELVQLRHDDAGLPKVQRQAPLEADEEGKTWLDEAVDDAEAMVRSEEFIAKRNAGCDPLRSPCACAPSNPKAGKSSDAHHRSF